MLCTRCKKRQAVVFVQRLENGKPVQEGYCLTCARELHIQPVDDLMKRFNMTMTSWPAWKSIWPT